MSYHWFSHKEVIAIKQHKCIWCGESINKCDSYKHEKSIYDGRFQNHHWHIECNAYTQNELFNSGEEEFLPYSNERPTMAEAYKADPTECDMTM